MLKLILFGIVVVLASSSPLTAQSQWCPEGECLASCPQTQYKLYYDWLWWSCPTRADCTPDPMQTCNRCYTSGLYWCSDPFSPYCHTCFLSGYNQFCGCQTGGACVEPTDSTKAKRGA